jgi:hypothetical protein
MICFFAEEDFVSIEIYKIGSSLGREGKCISLMFNPDPIAFFSSSLVQVDSYWQPEDLIGLGLLYKYPGILCPAVIIIADIKLWMAAAIEPLVPEPV